MIRTCMSPAAFCVTPEMEPVFIEVKPQSNYTDKPSYRVKIERSSKSRLHLMHREIVLETAEEAQILIELLTEHLREQAGVTPPDPTALPAE